MYVVGKTGTGKSTFLETLIRQDAEAGSGLALLDPHGSLIANVLTALPSHRRTELVHFNVADPTQRIGINPLQHVHPQARPLAASALIEVFRKTWAESWGPRVEHILRNTLLALLDQPRATLADILRLLHDGNFRRHAVDRVANQHVRDFWRNEYESYPARFKAEAIAPLENKVGAFLSNPLLARILTTEQSTLNIREVMDSEKILLVDLAKGRIGEDTASLLGSLLVTQVGLAALGRTDLEESARKDFYLYLDEFQNFTTLSLANMLSELRKYRVGMVLAHQYLSQLDLQVRDAILGNVGTIISFRIGMNDAEILAKEFYPEVSEMDFASLPNFNIYLRLMVEGTVPRPFSAETLGPFPTRSKVNDALVARQNEV